MRHRLFGKQRKRPVLPGFTLVELILSMALLGLVTALVYAAFFQTSQSARTVQATLSGRQELRLLMKMVLDDLQTVRYLRHWVDSGKGRESGVVAEVVLGPENKEASRLSFHAEQPTQYFQELDAVREGLDPQLHEVGYFLEYSTRDDTWQFIRREDFYLDDNLREPRLDGRQLVLSESVRSFQIQFRSEIEGASGFVEEQWEIGEWDSDETKCWGSKQNEPRCLPRAIQLLMTLEGEDGRLVEDIQQINLCVRPCNPEIFD